MARLRRVRTDDPGWTRRRYGSGWAYLDEDGRRIDDPEQVARCRDLVIPPAWRDVWICRDEHGHIQATGTDDAGRRQYLYHPQWRARRDRAKHDDVLALAFRLLDDAYFRAGGEAYARENGSYGLATVLREHVTVHRDGVSFCYPAKSGQLRETRVEDPAVRSAVRALRDRDDDRPELLAWRDGGAWHDVAARDIQAYLKELVGPGARPKDFRTWHATVLAAAALADADPPPRAERARRRVIAQVVAEVAEELGNTPAVCRASYVDPRLVDLWERGETIGRRRTRAAAERAVLELLG